ncbi:MAG: DMT family transporter [Candidatus Thorarchaeota archaeon]
MENKYYLYTLISAFVWGTSFPVVAYSLQYTEPALLLALRFGLATIISFFMLKINFRVIFYNKLLLFVGLLNGFAYFFQFLGQNVIPAGLSSILVNSYAIFVPIFSYFIVNEQITAKKITAAILGVFGVILISYNEISLTSSEHIAIYLLGIITVFFSGLLWALYVVYSKKAESKFQDRLSNGSLNENEITYKEVFFTSLFYTALIGLIVVLLHPTNITTIFSVEPIAGGIYLSIFCTMIPFFLYLQALEKIDASIVSIILLFEVIIAYIISILYLSESVEIIEIFGTIIIIFGIFIAIQSDASTKNNE